MAPPEAAVGGWRRLEEQSPGSGVAGAGFGTEAALFKLSGADDLVANVTMSFFQLGRSYLEGSSVYGDEGALEWPQLEGGPMKEFALQPLTEGRRGRAVTETDIRPAGVPEPESVDRSGC